MRFGPAITLVVLSQAILFSLALRNETSADDGSRLVVNVSRFWRATNLS
jgi:hypothetical protein